MEMCTMWMKTILVVLMFGQVRSDEKHSAACFSTARPCFKHNLNCEAHKVIGLSSVCFEEREGCTVGVTNCSSNCCQSDTEGKRVNLAINQLQYLYTNCSMERTCTYRMPQKVANIITSYSSLHFVCYHRNDIINVTEENTEKSGKDITILYRRQDLQQQSGDFEIFNCTVDHDESNNAEISVYALDFSLNASSRSHLTITTEESQTFNSSNPLYPYQNIITSNKMPINIFLQIYPARHRERIWIHLSSSSKFCVKCDNVKQPTTAPLTTTHVTTTENAHSTKDSITPLTTTHVTTTENAHSTKDSITPLTTTHVTTTENAHSTKDSITPLTNTHVTTTENAHSTKDSISLSVNTGAVAGGVTVAVLVILAVVLLLLWLRHKRNQKSKPPLSIGKAPGENYSVATRISDQNYHDIETMKPKESLSNYDYATVAGEVSHAGKEGQLPLEGDYAQIGEKRPKVTGHNNTTLLTAKFYNNTSFTENEDDYNHLASNEEKKPIENGVHSGGYDTAASASKSVQHIRNKGICNVDSDCDYNHIDNNPKPNHLQGDYDTTASASKAVAKILETNEQTEDDYDHFRQTKAGSQATDSPYDTAEHHAEQSGDYSIAGVLQKDDPFESAK